MKKIDVIILTQKEFHNPKNPDRYIKQVLKEDEYVKKALEKKGLKIIRTYWDNIISTFHQQKLYFSEQFGIIFIILMNSQYG